MFKSTFSYLLALVRRVVPVGLDVTVNASVYYKHGLNVHAFVMI